MMSSSLAASFGGLGSTRPEEGRRERTSRLLFLEDRRLHLAAPNSIVVSDHKGDHSLS